MSSSRTMRSNSPRYHPRGRWERRRTASGTSAVVGSTPGAKG